MKKPTCVRPASRVKLEKQMLSEPRSISYVLECIHAPVRHDAQDLKRLYAKTVEEPLLGYSNFNTGPMGAQMTAVHGPASFPNTTSHSVLAIGADRIQLKEEWPQISLDDFIGRSQAAINLVFQELKIPAFVAVQSMVRCLVSPQGVDDCRQWLNDRFVGINEDDVSVLGRSPGLFGLRMAFPGTEADPGLHNIRIESFGGDNRSVFLEDSAVYSGQVTKDETVKIENAVKGSYDFITGPVMNWLNSFDQ